MNPHTYDSNILFHKRLARVRRLNGGQQCPTDSRQKRRVVRILGLTHLHLYRAQPEVGHPGRAYRRALGRIK